MGRWPPVTWRYDPGQHLLRAITRAARGPTVEVVQLRARRWSDDDHQRMDHLLDPAASLPPESAAGDIVDAVLDTLGDDAAHIPGNHLLILTVAVQRGDWPRARATIDAADRGGGLTSQQTDDLHAVLDRFAVPR